MPPSDIGLALVAEITKLTTRLVETGMVDNQNYVTRTLHGERRWSVAQPGADMAIALKKQPYADVYLELRSTGNYAMHLLDGALFQFSYSGEAGKIERHRLAYLPAPDLVPYQNDPDLYFGENHFVDIVGHQVMPVPIRFDFDARQGVATDLVHPVSHVTFGQYQHCRVPVSRAVAPAEFVAFVLAAFYSTPDKPQEHLVSDITLGEPTITLNESARAHILVP